MNTMWSDNNAPTDGWTDWELDAQLLRGNKTKSWSAAPLVVGGELDRKLAARSDMATTSSAAPAPDLLVAWGVPQPAATPSNSASIAVVRPAVSAAPATTTADVQRQRLACSVHKTRQVTLWNKRSQMAVCARCLASGTIAKDDLVDLMEGLIAAVEHVREWTHRASHGREIVDRTTQFTTLIEGVPRVDLSTEFEGLMDDAGSAVGCMSGRPLVAVGAVPREAVEEVTPTPVLLEHESPVTVTTQPHSKSRHKRGGAAHKKLNHNQPAAVTTAPTNTQNDIKSASVEPTNNNGRAAAVVPAAAAVGTLPPPYQATRDGHNNQHTSSLQKPLPPPVEPTSTASSFADVIRRKAAHGGGSHRK